MFNAILDTNETIDKRRYGVDKTYRVNGNVN